MSHPAPFDHVAARKLELEALRRGRPSPRRAHKLQKRRIHLAAVALGHPRSGKRAIFLLDALHEYAALRLTSELSTPQIMAAANTELQDGEPLVKRSTARQWLSILEEAGLVAPLPRNSNKELCWHLQELDGAMCDGSVPRRLWQAMKARRLSADAARKRKKYAEKREGLTPAKRGRPRKSSPVKNSLLEHGTCSLMPNSASQPAKEIVSTVFSTSCQVPYSDPLAGALDSDSPPKQTKSLKGDAKSEHSDDFEPLTFPTHRRPVKTTRGCHMALPHGTGTRLTGKLSGKTLASAFIELGARVARGS